MILSHVLTLSQIDLPVASTSNKKPFIIWNPLFFIVPLQCRKETTTTERRKENKYNN